MPINSKISISNINSKKRDFLLEQKNNNIDGEDYQTQDYEDGMKYENINEFFNSEIKSNFLKSISDISPVLIIETYKDKQDYIESFEWRHNMDENFIGSCDFIFNINGFRQICEFYVGDLHLNKEQLFKVATNYLEKCFRQRCDCKYHTICKIGKQYNKQVFCLDSDKK